MLVAELLWCPGCQGHVDSDDGKCPDCRGAALTAGHPSECRERRWLDEPDWRGEVDSVGEEPVTVAVDPMLKECGGCGETRVHAPRPDDPTKPRSRCPDCLKNYYRRWREVNWQRRKARDTWKGMVARCHDPEHGKGTPPGIPRYRDYGAKGVKVCARWRSPKGFAAFLADAGLPPTKRHTLDRRNSSRNYSCGRCPWCILESLEWRYMRRSNNFVDMTDQRVGMLVVLEFAGTARGHGAKWLCRCDCGNEKVVSRASLRESLNGRQCRPTSCGCMQGKGAKPRSPKLAVEDAAINSILRVYHYSAKRRDLSWSLTENQFRRIIGERCYYCVAPPSNVQKVKRTSTDSSGEFLYSGIDRKDNEGGYSIGNCVPCCETCNHAKHKMSHDEFLAWVERLASNQGLFQSNTRWVDPDTQRTNRKNARWITARDPATGRERTMILSDWARLTGVNRHTIAKRIERGWDVDRAVAEPTPRMLAAREAEACPF